MFKIGKTLFFANIILALILSFRSSHCKKYTIVDEYDKDNGRVCDAECCVSDKNVVTYYSLEEIFQFQMMITLRNSRGAISLSVFHDIERIRKFREKTLAFLIFVTSQ